MPDRPDPLIPGDVVVLRGPASPDCFGVIESILPSGASLRWTFDSGKAWAEPATAAVAHLVRVTTWQDRIARVCRLNGWVIGHEWRRQGRGWQTGEGLCVSTWWTRPVPDDPLVAMLEHERANDCTPLVQAIGSAA